MPSLWQGGINMGTTFKKNIFWIIAFSSIILGGILFALGISLGGSTSFNIDANGITFQKGFIPEITTDVQIDFVD